ncbi:hypothetical protein Tco_0593101 [Tanacetum coccineum]
MSFYFGWALAYFVCVLAQKPTSLVLSPCLMWPMIGRVLPEHRVTPYVFTIGEDGICLVNISKLWLGRYFTGSGSMRIEMKSILDVGERERSASKIGETGVLEGEMEIRW